MGEQDGVNYDMKSAVHEVARPKSFFGLVVSPPLADAVSLFVEEPKDEIKQFCGKGLEWGIRV